MRAQVALLDDLKLNQDLAEYDTLAFVNWKSFAPTSASFEALQVAMSSPGGSAEADLVGDKQKIAWPWCYTSTTTYRYLFVILTTPMCTVPRPAAVRETIFSLFLFEDGFKHEEGGRLRLDGHAYTKLRIVDFEYRALLLPLPGPKKKTPDFRR